MNEVRSIVVLSDGAPGVDNIAWYETRLETTQRIDPFSGKTREFKTWVAGAPASGDRAQERARVDLATSSGWTRAQRALDRSFHDGLVFESWVAVLGADEAKPHWRPQWVAADGSMLFAFPAAVIEWLRGADASEVRRAAARWADLPYLANAADGDGALVAATFLDLLRPLVARAAQGDGVFAVASPKQVQP